MDKNKKQNFISIGIFLFMFFIFLITNIHFQKIIYGENNYNFLYFSSLKYNHFIEPIFWKSSFGISLKAVIDIIVTSLLITLALWLFEIKKSFILVIGVVSICYIVFYFQMCIEFFYISHVGAKNVDLGRFSLFSLSYLFNNLSLYVPSYFNYAISVISLFEILFVLFLILGIKKLINSSFIYSFKIIIISYLLPLIIWLLIITFISLLFST